MPLVNSTVDFIMVSTRKRKQQKKRLLSQLSESDANLMIGQSSREDQTEKRSDRANRVTFLYYTNEPTQVNGSQGDMHTLDKNIVSKVRSGVDSVKTMVETRVHHVLLSSIKILVTPRVELAVKSVNASPGRGIGGVVSVPYQKDFSGNIGGLQTTAASRINSHTDSNRIIWTRGNITVEGGDFLVDERNIDRQTHTHHSCSQETEKNSNLVKNAVLEKFC